jgi:hypothetical protein
MSELNDCEHAALDLFLAFERTGESHFTAHLFRLIHKADSVNRGKLAQSYPVHVAIFQEWWGCDAPQTFYDKYHVFDHLREKEKPV